MNRVPILTDAAASESERLTDEQEAIFNHAFRLIEMFRRREISFQDATVALVQVYTKLAI